MVSGLLLAQGQAEAAALGMKIPGKAKAAPETYAATESIGTAVPDTLDGESSDSAEAQTTPPAPPPQAPGQVASAEAVLPSPPAPPAQAHAPASVPAQPESAQAERGAYDPVPSNQRAAIARRLRLAEKLILEYGRAYDYRIHTVAELEHILEKLQKGTQAPQSSHDL